MGFKLISKKIKSNQAGVTFIEVLIVMAIIGLILGIGYPMLSQNRMVTDDRLSEISERNDIRAITNFLRNDIRYSDDLVEQILETDTGFVYTISSPGASSVVYTRQQHSDGRWYVVRQLEGQTIEFTEIRSMQMESISDALVGVTLKVCCEDDPDLVEEYSFRIARWRWQLALGIEDEEKTIYELLEDDDYFVIGAGFAMAGNTVSGDGATVLIRNDLTSGDLNGNAKIRVSNIYIDGNVDLIGSRELGSLTQPGVIVIDGDVTLGGSSVLTGDVYISGNLTMGGSARINGNLYVQGDFDFNNGRIENGQAFIGGNLYIKDGTLDGAMYVNGNVTIGWTPAFTTGSKIYYYGTLTKPSSYNAENFETMDSQVLVPSAEIPAVGIPMPRDPQWYEDNGYVLNGDLEDNAKIYVTSGDYVASAGGTVSNVIVVNLAEGGNVSITGGNLNLSGVIYAPYGSVTVGGSSFTGLVIAANGSNMSSGGMEVTFSGIENFIADSSQYPFLNEMMPVD